MKHGLVAWGAAALLLAVPAGGIARPAADGGFYPAWASAARYVAPLRVLDTDSALGRLNLRPKTISLEDLARMHGHLCDGLATAWVELGVALRALFPGGVVDRTDVRVVAKNAPCLVDAGSWMTGARVNQGTLMLDPSLGEGFIVQRISTGQTVRVSPRPGVYPASLAALERSIRAAGAEAKPADIDRYERGADAYIRRILNTPPARVVELERLPGYVFPKVSLQPIVPRSDIVNRDIAR